MPGLVGHVLSDLPSSFMQAGDGYSGNYWGSIWYISVTPSGHKLSVCCLPVCLYNCVSRQTFYYTYVAGFPIYIVHADQTHIYGVTLVDRPPVIWRRTKEFYL